MKQKGKTKAKILISAVLICLLSFLLMVVYIPKIFGYKALYITNGSMSPSITKGSMILEKKVEFEEISEGDVVTFQNDSGTEFFTHRVISIDTANKMFKTKGDANEEPDPSEISYYFAVGKVDFAMPLIGYVLQLLSSTAGKIGVACIYIAWIAVEIEVFVMKRKAPQED